MREARHDKSCRADQKQPGESAKAATAAGPEHGECAETEGHGAPPASSDGRCTMSGKDLGEPERQAVVSAAPEEVDAAVTNDIGRLFAADLLRFILVREVVCNLVLFGRREPPRGPGSIGQHEPRCSTEKYGRQPFNQEEPLPVF